MQTRVQHNYIYVRIRSACLWWTASSCFVFKMYNKSYRNKVTTRVRTYFVDSIYLDISTIYFFLNISRYTKKNITLLRHNLRYQLPTEINAISGIARFILPTPDPSTSTDRTYCPLGFSIFSINRITR